MATINCLMRENLVILQRDFLEIKHCLASCLKSKGGQQGRKSLSRE